ncbi:hypothetical protein CPB84DRAFT_1745059 [Gymnopilus junonius]|uniref:Uncharacterized protein n=1 Tax=Gymnopilus junonius TaxID=109634 RepID=A0A9P5TR50_GYMJU|nr:hypothetical protein CPB84DRAFT_1745059 [Gymnopilus junonius]
MENPEAITDLSLAQVYDVLVEQHALMVYAHAILVLIPPLLVPNDIKAFWQYHHLIYQRLNTFACNQLGNPDWITNFGVLPLDISYKFPPVDPNSIPLTDEILAKAWALYAAELAREEANHLAAEAPPSPPVASQTQRSARPSLSIPAPLLADLDASTPSWDLSPFHPVRTAKCKVIATLGEGSKVKKAKVVHNNTKAKTPALLLEAMESIHHCLPPKIRSWEVVPWITTKQASIWHAEVARPICTVCIQCQFTMTVHKCSFESFDKPSLQGMLDQVQFLSYNHFLLALQAEEVGHHVQSIADQALALVKDIMEEDFEGSAICAILSSEECLALVKDHFSMLQLPLTPQSQLTHLDQLIFQLEPKFTTAILTAGLNFTHLSSFDLKSLLMDPLASTSSLIDNKAEETEGSGSEETESTSSEDGSSDEDDPIQWFIKSGVKHQLTHQDPDAQDEEMETDED